MRRIDIDHPFWTAAGKAAALRHGLDMAEVIDVIEDVECVQVLWDDVPMRLELLGGLPGQRAIVALLDREYRETTRYGITDVRPATDGENHAWEKRQR